MRELVETARQWLAEGRAGYLARPVTEQGFGPRDPAGAVLVDARGACRRPVPGVFDAELVAEAGAMGAAAGGVSGAAGAAGTAGVTARVCEVSVLGRRPRRRS
ncbi:hypothetical protein WKI68_15775 [Streptomyces sp. MS1.HAVA.3]|uniref:Uncharacterized protein n=1 Tax=Streptomyces caledonius TaxID=3134107 RepID=A0ABU8U3N3_9ACTN